MAKAAFGKALPTDRRYPEWTADSILVRVVITRRATTVADRALPHPSPCLIATSSSAGLAR